MVEKEGHENKDKRENEKWKIARACSWKKKS